MRLLRALRARLTAVVGVRCAGLRPHALHLVSAYVDFFWFRSCQKPVLAMSVTVRVCRSSCFCPDIPAVCVRCGVSSRAAVNTADAGRRTAGGGSTLPRFAGTGCGDTILPRTGDQRSEEHTSELQSQSN